MMDADERSTLRYHLHRHLSRSEPGRPLDVIHASDVIDDDHWWCPRRAALMLHGRMRPPEERLSTVDSVIYRYSADVAARVIFWLSELNLAVGDWICANCDHVHIFGLRPDKCERCGQARLRYQEVRFTSQVSGISGGIDVFAHLPRIQKVRPVEIKALQKEDFVSIVAPKGVHRLRTNLYLRLIAESDHPLRDYIDTRHGIILYVSKGGYGMKSTEAAGWGLMDKPWTPFKEFLVERDDSATQRFTDLARPLYDWMKDPANVSFPERICDTPACKRAQACEVRERCWR